MQQDREWLTEAELADWLGVSIAKLQADRYKERGAPYTKLGRVVRYRRSDIESWLAAQRVAAGAT